MTQDISSTTATGDYPVIGTAPVVPSALLAPGAEGHNIDLPRSAVAFDVDAFDSALYEHGVAMLHYRAMRCPVGMISVSDVRKAHEDHPGCSHGFLYTYGGLFHGVFTGQSTEKADVPLGASLSGNAQVTAPRFYTDHPDVPLHVGIYDRIYLAQPGMDVVNWQLFTVGEGEVDRLDFPAERVVDLVDSEGRVYAQDVDFRLVNGRVRWQGSRPRPGMVCAARYLYRPYWYVRYMPHELRIARGDGLGEPGVQRMPQALALQREWLFESELARHPEDALTAPVSARQPQPASTGPNFGSR